MLRKFLYSFGFKVTWMLPLKAGYLVSDILAVLNYLLARVIRLDHETLVAFTIHTPQKTLAVSFLVWSGSFATTFPGAFVPAIICHLLQMISGTLIAQYFRKPATGP